MICVNASAQIPFQMDTLTIEDRMGSALDSVDVSNANYATTFDGGLCINCPSGFSTLALFNQIQNPIFQPTSQLTDDIKFSGLPHLGFAYTFGGQGAQFIRGKYIHSFRNNTILNIAYDRNIGAGVLRRSAFSNNNIVMDLVRKGKRYSFTLHGNYQNNTIQHPGGIKTDTLINDFGLEFTPVFKLSTESINKYGNVFLRNYINFTRDSINQFGLIIAHQYTINNRVYTEYDTLYGLYNNVYIDSFATRDQYNLPVLKNGAGFYKMSSNGKLYADIYAMHVYWDYQNLGLHQYQNEYNLNSLIGYRSNKWMISNRAYYNLSGRFNEWSDYFNIGYRLKNGQLSASVNLIDKALDPWQRRYFANQYDYDLLSFSNQFSFSGQVNVEYEIVDSMLTGKLFADYTSIRSPYLININTTQEFTNSYIENFDMASVGVAFSLRYKLFNMHIKGIYTSDTYGYIPDMQFYVRPFIQTGIFKAKKLQMALGVDFSYVSQYNIKSYVPNIDYFNWFAGTSNTNSISNMHAFLSLGIDEFRFYVRYENIGYFWNDKTTQILANYPLAGTRLRVGITWDFFN